MTYDPRIPAREICVLGYQIEHWALQKPGAIAIMFYGGEIWTWRQTLELTQRTAKGLQAMGVKKGDHVLS